MDFSKVSNSLQLKERKKAISEIAFGNARISCYLPLRFYNWKQNLGFWSK